MYDDGLKNDDGWKKYRIKTFLLMSGEWHAI